MAEEFSGLEWKSANLEQGKPVKSFILDTNLVVKLVQENGIIPHVEVGSKIKWYKKTTASKRCVGQTKDPV